MLFRTGRGGVRQWDGEMWQLLAHIDHRRSRGSQRDSCAAPLCPSEKEAWYSLASGNQRKRVVGEWEYVRWENLNDSGVGNLFSPEITPIQMIGSSAAETCGMRGDAGVEEDSGA